MSLRNFMEEVPMYPNPPAYKLFRQGRERKKKTFHCDYSHYIAGSSTLSKGTRRTHLNEAGEGGVDDRFEQGRLRWTRG